MTPWHFPVIALILGATALAVVHALHTGASRWKKSVFVTVRILFGALLLIAFLEPAVTVHRLPDRNRSIPVLIDASRSMSLFAADSAVRLFKRNCAAIERNSPADGRTLSWFLFGDSLRRVDDPLKATSNDRKSFFPGMNDDPVIRDAAGLIIISDGNWSNPAPFASDLATKAVWYLPLVSLRHIPSINCPLPDTIVSSAAAPRTLYLPCSGAASGNATITLAIIDKGKIIAADSFTVAAGLFVHTFEAHLPSCSAGLHLYEVKVTGRSDTLTQSRFLLHHVIPDAFVYRLAAKEPSLDVRFFRLALAGTPQFVDEAAAGNEKQDVLFIFGDVGTDVPLPPLPVLPVYIGCLPGKPARIDSTATTKFFLADNSIPNPLYQLPLQDLPPVTSMVKNRAVTSVQPWLSAQCGNDTVPLLFRGFFHDRPVFACAFTGFWKWDFLPLSHASGESDAFNFSRRFIAAVAATLHTLNTDTLLVFPSGVPTAANPAGFSCIAPSGGSAPASLQLSCTVRKNDGTAVTDTAIEIIPTGSLRQQFSLPAFAAGSYTIECSLATPEKKYHSRIPFAVVVDNSELLVTAQNEALLREIGQPLINDSLHLNALLKSSYRTFTQQPVTKRIVLKRSWWLLGALLFLLGIEWLMRRVAELD